MKLRISQNDFGWRYLSLLLTNTIQIYNNRNMNSDSKNENFVSTYAEYGNISLLIVKQFNWIVILCDY